MNEGEIKRRVRRMETVLDDEYLSTSMSVDSRKLRQRQIDDWAWMRRYENTLEQDGALSLSLNLTTKA